jgi:PAS domain S-box-containing protein
LNEPEEIILMNSDAAGGKNQSRNHLLLLVVAVIIILFGGIVLTIWTAQNENTNLQQQLLVKNRLIKEAFGTNQIQQLTGSEADVSSPVYAIIKEDLIRIRLTDPQIRFVYFMGQQPDGKIVFLVDSEPPESPDYSPPGQEYPEASEALQNVFVLKGEIMEGPTSDRWGTWMSSLLPIIDPTTGKVIAVLGMDVDASDWNMHILYAALPVIIGTLILLFIILVFSYMQQRNDREKQILKESENILRQSEHRLNDIINFLPDATFVIDIEGRVITWNRAMEEMTGIKAGDMLGKRNYEYALPFYQARRPMLINLVLEPDSEIEKKYTGGVHRQGTMLMTETELRRPDGSVFILAARALPISEDDGTVIGAIESIRDITFRKKAENALKISEERLRLLLQNINDGIIVHEVSHDGPRRILEVNDRVCEMLGYTQEEFLQMSVQDLDVPEQQANVAAISDLLFSRKYAIFETELIKKDRQRIPVEISSRLFELQGKPTVLAIIRDITDRKATELAMENYSLELTRFAEILQKTNDKLNLMNSITRHDILNQLTLILGYLELMKEQYQEPELQKYIGAELRAAQTIQKQIMFTKEYQDIGSQHPKWFNLNSVILSAATGLSLAPIRLSVDCNQFEILADPLLEKVFYTLLENAIRHGKKVTDIVFSCLEQENGLIVIYEDNGAGIPADHKKDIFNQKYFQHTGYGLFLSTTILNITGISIRECGEPGKGARFEILVPKGAYRHAGTS